MKANLSKSLIPAVLVIAGLAAGTALLAGYVDGPNKAPQTAVKAGCDGCPRLNGLVCSKTTGVCADSQNSATPFIVPAASATPCPGMAAHGASSAGMAKAVTPCTGGQGCPMPCCQEPGETPPTGCTMHETRSTGCPFMMPSGQTTSPCGAGGCTLAK